MINVGKNMKPRVMLICFAFALVGKGRCDQEFYATASVGRVLGRYDTAITNTPFASYEKSRDSLSPSLAAGCWFSRRSGVELGYTGDGSYCYDYEYGLSPFARPGGVNTAVTQRLLIREKLYDVALRAPIRLPLGPRCKIEFYPGIARQELYSSYAARQVLGVAVAVPISSPTSSPGPLQISDRPLFSQTTGRWAWEAGARVSWSLSRALAIVGGYRYSPAPQKNISLLSLGLSAKY
jgi:hypothetical protein